MLYSNLQKITYLSIIVLSIFLSKSYSQEEPIHVFQLNPLSDIYDVIKAIDISPDDSLIALGGEQASVWNFKTGEFIRMVDIKYVNSMDFSSNGSKLVVGASTSGVIFDTKLWNLVAFIEFGEYTLYGSDVRTIKFTPDDQNVIAGYKGDLYIWNYRNDKIVDIIDPEQGSTTSIQFIGNNHQILLGGEVFYDYFKKSIVAEYSYFLDKGQKRFISENNKYLLTREVFSSGVNQSKSTLNMYDFQNFELLSSFTIDGHGHVALSPNGRFVCYRNSFEAFLIDFKDKNNPKIVKKIPGHYFNYLHTSFNSNGEKLVLATSKNAYLYDISDLYTSVSDSSKY